MKHIILSIAICLIISCKQKDSVQEDNNTSQAKTNETMVQQKACTKDAKLCPNGRSIMRNPQNNCEFDPCPTKSAKIEEKLCTADVKQCSDGSYVGRDGFNNCQFNGCPPSSNGRDNGLN